MHKHVIFCTDGIFPHAVGGMQRHSKLLIEHLAEIGSFTITVIHPHASPVFDKDLNIEEITIEGISPNRNYLLECYQYSKRVSAILEEYPEAIIYSQGLSVWHKCSQFKERLIVNPHGLEPYQAISKKDRLIGLPFRLIFNYIFSNGRYVISLGGRLTAILKANISDKSKIITIPNAVTMPDALVVAPKNSRADDTLQALFVARFAHNKGIHILLDAIKRLNEQGYENKFNFKLIGKGPLYDHYTLNHKIDNVEYLGFLDDDTLEKTYASSDVFVFPTLFEGMPTVVLEAMAKGLPVIVSDTGATAELVDRTNGYLIPKNDVGALVDALISFSKLSSKDSELMGKESISKVEKQFNWRKVADLTAKLIESL